LGERLDRTQEVAGSSPASSIKLPANLVELTFPGEAGSSQSTPSLSASGEAPDRPECLLVQFAFVGRQPSAPFVEDQQSRGRASIGARKSGVAVRRRYRSALRVMSAAGSERDCLVAQAVTRPVGAGVIAFVKSNRGASAAPGRSLPRECRRKVPPCDGAFGVIRRFRHGARRRIALSL
jgi:hypothetical protein